MLSARHLGVQVGEHVLSSRRSGNLRKAADGLSSPVVSEHRHRGGAAGRSRSDPRGGAQALRVPARPLAEAPTGSGGQYRPGLVAVAAAEPQPNFSLTPPSLRAAGIPPHLVATKSDLLTGETREMFEIYRRAGWPLLHQQRHGGESPDDRGARRPGEPDHRHFWCRQSSLLNALEPGLGLRAR